MLIAFFLTFGVVEYQTLRQSLLSEMDRTLQLRARHLTDGYLQGIRLREEPLGEASEVVAEVVAADGRVIMSSDNLEGSRLPSTAHSGEVETLEAAPGLSVRLFSQEVRDPAGRIVATVRVGESLQQVNRSLADSRTQIALAGVLLLILSLAAASAALTRGLAPLRDMARTIAHIVETGDVSLRVPVPPGTDQVSQVAASFNSLLARVADVLEAHSRLLSDTSHELRNPLTVIQTDLDMLDKELDSDTRREVAEEAGREVKRVIRLVEDLLLISWAESSPRLQLEPVELLELAQQTVARMAALAQGRRLAVEGVPTLAQGDPDRLAQILRNLIDNSIRHTAAEGRITLRVGPGQIAVEDNGQGIGPEHVEHIFERFYQVDPVRSRGSSGAGLGLPLARALARLQGGDLTVRSEPGRTVFTLFIESSSVPHASLTPER